MNGKIHEKIRNAVYPDTNIQIINDSVLEIEDCRKIIEYNDIHICVRTNMFEIHIWGEGLSADDYGGGGITVKGKIKSVEFERLRI